MKTVFKTQAALVVSLLFFAVPVLAGKDVQERGTPAQAKEMAAQALALFDREGAKAGFARFNERPAPDFKHLDLYIFVARARDAVILAHGADRSLLGIDAATLVDPKGLNIGRAILARATENVAWVDYGWKDPVSAKVLAQVLMGGAPQGLHLRVRCPKTLNQFLRLLRG